MWQMVVDTNLRFYRESGPQMKFSVRMGIVYGKILGEIGEIFPNLLDSM